MQISLFTKQITLALLGGATIAGGVGASIYLSQDKTIKDMLISKGIELSKSVEDYQVAFKELKGKGDFNKDIKALERDITLELGGIALNKWCEEHLEKSLSEKSVNNITEKTKKYCSLLPLTIKEKFEKSNKQLIVNWKVKITSLKVLDTNNELQRDLALIDSKITSLDLQEQDIVSNALKKWCNTNIIKKTIEDANDEIWKKVENRCIEGIKK